MGSVSGARSWGLHFLFRASFGMLFSLTRDQNSSLGCVLVCVWGGGVLRFTLYDADMLHKGFYHGAD
jgi:hypothetical protein